MVNTPIVIDDHPPISLQTMRTILYLIPTRSRDPTSKKAKWTTKHQRWIVCRLGKSAKHLQLGRQVMCASPLMGPYSTTICPVRSISSQRDGTQVVSCQISRGSLSFDKRGPQVSWWLACGSHQSSETDLGVLTAVYVLLAVIVIQV